jgi:hypothetical protein
VWQCRKTAIFRAFRASSGTQPLESCRLSAPVFDRHVNASARIETLPLPASDRLQKGKGGWMQFSLSSLPYFISPFVKRPPSGQPAKKRMFNGSSKLRDGQRGSRGLCSVWIGVGEIEEAAGAYAETKIEELAETETSFDHPELAHRIIESDPRL